MEKFCESVKENAMKTFDLIKQMEFLTKEQQESCENAKICYIC